MTDRNAKIAESHIAAAEVTSANPAQEIDRLRAIVQRLAGYLDEAESHIETLSAQNGFMICDLQEWQDGRKPETTY